MASMREMIEQRVERLENYHRSLKTRRHGWLVRPAILVAGSLVTLAGIGMIPLPGQGWLTVFVGVAILSLEARWARGVLRWGVGAYDGVSRWYRSLPLPGRVVAMTSLVAVIVATFFLLAWASWRFGGVEFLDPLFTGVLGW